jgi:hypothetical protein
MEEKDLFRDLDKDSKTIIFSYLDIKGIRSAIFVCKEWKYFISNNQDIFKWACQRLWDINAPDNNIDWRRVYCDILLKDYKSVDIAEDWSMVEKSIHAISNRDSNTMMRMDYLYCKGNEKFKNCSPLLGNYGK